MSEDAEKKKELIRRAREEFQEKGFAGASLRSICNKAGVTTGAVYFFFKDKDGLFHAVVDGMLQKFWAALINHVQEDFDEDFETYQRVRGDHDEISEMLLNVLYDDYEISMLLLRKAAGSSYENVLDQIVAVLEGYYGRLAQKYADSRPGKKVDQYMLHYLTHVQVDGFVQLLSQVPEKEEAKKHVNTLMDFFVDGWLNYVLTDE